MLNLNRAFFLSGALLAFGCEITPPNLSGVIPQNNAGGQAATPDDDESGTTDTTAEETPEPARPAACDADLDVTFDVKLHTLFVNNSLLIDGMFTWQASGASGQLVDLDFKTNATEWTTIAADLPSADVKTLDLSHYAGPSSSWHFRASTWHPACPENLSLSPITTIQN